MRLTLVLVLAALGIVAKAKPDSLTVKAHVAVKSGSRVLSKDLSGIVRRSSRGVKCQEPEVWEEKGTLYSYCPKEDTAGHTKEELESGNYVKTAISPFAKDTIT